MKDRAAEHLIDVEELKVGMFIHLDLGWMSHPFPLSSFKLASEDQLLILRRLGLKKVRWNPDKSDAPFDPTLPEPVASPDTSATPPPAPSPDAAAEAALREALKVQRESLQLCERQYAEASQALKELTDLIPIQPETARDQSQALSQALLDKMLVEGDLSIRLLTETTGDRATAHGLNVAIISLLLGRACGLSVDELAQLGVGALLHDIGKMELPMRFRQRDESFTAAEMQLYQQHVAKGVALGQKMGLASGPLLVIAQHHEHIDFSGFPQRIGAEKMSVGARIVALVNRFDGLCNPAVAAKALTPHEALSLLFAQGRSRFDATMLNAFIRMMGVYPPGSAVQLTDDRYALVVAVNSSRPLKPRVMVHDAKVPRDEALLLNLEELPELGIRRSLKPQQLPMAAADYLSPRSRVAYFFEPSVPSPRSQLAA
ncbi:HD-GYP domain-containing protein [Roseateles sp. BYS180W]|uniref:HD-GYP domain-containing protein n=1 Tax=Roseateles rivi TaxID=3299028 RepID=A0ABW7FUL9_9BURK